MVCDYCDFVFWRKKLTLAVLIFFQLRDLSGGGNAFELKTLEDIVTENGDLGRAINYLKIDVEGSELLAIPQWLETPEILENIDQIQIEIHTQVQAGVFHIHSEGDLLRGTDKKTVRCKVLLVLRNR